VVVRSVGRSAMAGWLAQLVPYRGWLVKGVGGLICWENYSWPAPVATDSRRG